MKIIIFSAFDGVPYSDEEPMRYATLADEYLKNGHEITYLTASYSHIHKRSRKIGNTPDRLKIVLLPTKSYAHNIGIDRIISHYHLSLALSYWLEKLGPDQYPTLVIGASPPIFSNYVLSNFCKKHNIPFIYDIQDLWPEEFVRLLPGKQALKFIMRPYFASAERIVRQASAVTAVASEYLDYYKKQIGDKPSSVFYLGIDTGKFATLAPPSTVEAGTRKVIIIGNEATKKFVLLAAEVVKDMDNIELVICLKGKSGLLNKEIAEWNRKKERITTVDWLDQEKIYKLFPQMDLALLLIDQDSKVGFPNRSFTYFAAGLPVINSIKSGNLEKIIRDHQLGVTLNRIRREDVKEAILQCLTRYQFEDRVRIQQFAREHFDRKDIYEQFYHWIMNLKFEK